MVKQLEIMPYDPQWVLEFQAERDRISTALGILARRIDHNGSTSVPGLAAKPVIDIQVSLEQIHPIAVFAGRLSQLGYVHKPHADDAFCPYLHRPREWPHTHHVHVVQAGGVEERRTLAFRDYLREHGDVAREYETLKRELAARFNAAESSSREGYASAKGEFIERIVQVALATGYPRSVRLKPDTTCD
jgi:GrpB-like predicted nucleotidyltransferase (UPF0157 family)